MKIVTISKVEATHANYKITLMINGKQKGPYRTTKGCAGDAAAIALEFACNSGAKDIIGPSEVTSHIPNSWSGK